MGRGEMEGRTRAAGGAVERVAGEGRALDPPDRATVRGVVHAENLRAVHGRAFGEPLGREEVPGWGCGGLRLGEEGGSRQEERERAGVR